MQVEIGDSDFGQAMLAGGSMGTSSWGAAVVKACRVLRTGQDEVHVDTADDAEADEPLSKHGFGAQFVEVRVNVDTGEIRVPRVARRVRVRPDPEPEDGALAVHRRDDDGHLDGAARGDA